MKQRRWHGQHAAVYERRRNAAPHRGRDTANRAAIVMIILVLLSALAVGVPSCAVPSAQSEFSSRARCDRSGTISCGNVKICELSAAALGVRGTHVVSARRHRRSGRRDGHEPVNEQFLYCVPGPAEAAGVVRRLDVLPPDRLVGLAVIARGYRDDPEEFYVFANTEDLSERERALIVDTFTAFGTPTSLTIQQLAWGTPKPHLLASGDVDTIIPTLQAYYPSDPGSFS